MIYDTNYTPNEDLNNSTDLGMWIDKEVIPYFVAFGNVTFNQLFFVAEEETATTTTYAKTTWRGDIGTVPGSNKVGQETTHRIYDFYIMRDDKIRYDWMLLDMVEIMFEAGYRVLPKSELREGWVAPPAAMDGIPAPISRLVNPMDGPNSKILVEETLLHDIVYGSEASHIWTEDMKWYGPFGIGYASNKQDYEEFYLKPLREGISERQVEINVLTCEGAYCGVNGFIHGVHSGPWLGEEAKKGWKYGTWGEDLFMQRTMDDAEVSKISDFSLTTSGTCPGDRPKDKKDDTKYVPPCKAGETKAAVHPFRDVASWFKCLGTITGKQYS